jgi:hypothetical protein
VNSQKLSISIYAAEFFHDRTEVQCLHRWQKVLNPELIKGPWTQEVCNCSFDFTFREKETAAFFIHAKFLEEDVISVLFYRKMTKSSTLCASMDQQNGLS